MRLFRQIHLAQKCLEARICGDVLQRRVSFDAVQAWIFLSMGALEPIHGFIGLPAKCIYLGDSKRVPVRLLFEDAGKRSVRLRDSSERVIHDRQARLPYCVIRFLLDLEQCGVRVTTREQYETQIIAAPTVGRANIQRPADRGFCLRQMATTHQRPRENDERARVQRILSK